jgi:hypothetical protein
VPADALNNLLAEPGPFSQSFVNLSKLFKNSPTPRVPLKKCPEWTLAKNTHDYEAQKSKPTSKIKTPSKKSSRAESHTMKGI